jgi:hypothetical protein
MEKLKGQLDNINEFDKFEVLPAEIACAIIDAYKREKKIK